jgi:glycosyltransferase involved in cell wall biosynthesis
MRAPALSEIPAPPPDKTGWPWTEETPRADKAQLPRISIVMPSLDQVAYLEAAIRSVLLQGYPDLELIVVDGGSIDGSVDVLRRYEEWLTAWTSEPDGGQYDAINRGFERSTGTVLGWLNSDDMLVPGALAMIGAVFADLGDRVEWVTGLPGAWDEDGIPADVGAAPRYRRDWIEAGYYEGRLLGWIQQESTFWTRNLWDSAGGRIDSSLRYAGDFELWRRFAFLAPLRVIEAQLAGFRTHDAQKTALGLDEYYAEIDAHRGRLAPTWVKLGQRTRFTRRLLLDSYARLRSRDGGIAYDRSQQRWALTR